MRRCVDSERRDTATKCSIWQRWCRLQCQPLLRQTCYGGVVCDTVSACGGDEAGGDGSYGDGVSSTFFCDVFSFWSFSSCVVSCSCASSSYALSCDDPFDGHEEGLGADDGGAVDLAYPCRPLAFSLCFC